MNANRFSQLLNQFEIVAVDDYEQKPSRIYIAKTTNEVTELTEVIAIDLFKPAVYEPQKAGSYAKFLCPIRKILPEKENVDEMWEQIKNLPETIKNEIIKLTNTKIEQMEELNLKKAYYIKLGSKKDNWEKECIENGTIRIGWRFIKNIDDINKKNWDEVKRLIIQDFAKRGKNNGSTQDFNALQQFCEATEEDVFITFYKNKMYWCNPSNKPLKRYNENSQTDFTKVRETKNGWKCSPINNLEKIFHSNEISGQISKTQAFQGTFCSFTPDETKIINRIINGIPNPVVKKIEKHREKIIKSIVILLKELHWKDCEILTDLIFLHSGWRRISMSGGSMEFVDMEYEEPINNYKYAVQVKAKANKNDIEGYIKNLKGRHFEKMFFVVFYPDESIKKEYQMNKNNLEIIDGEKLANYIFDLGLLGWLLKKTF